MFELFIGLCVVLACLLYKYSQKPDKFPPGPPRIPLIGSSAFMPKEVKDGKKKFQIHMAETYGPISGTYVGNTPAVILSDYELIKDVFKR